MWTNCQVQENDDKDLVLAPSEIDIPVCMEGGSPNNVPPKMSTFESLEPVNILGYVARGN